MTKFISCFARETASKYAIFFLLLGTSFFWTPSANAESTGQIIVVCANDAGESREFRVGWDNTTQFFENKGNIAALFCSIATQGQWKTFISTTAPESTWYYNGVAPAPTASPSPEPSPSPSPTVTETVTVVDTSTSTGNTDTSIPVSETPTVVETNTATSNPPTPIEPVPSVPTPPPAVEPEPAPQPAPQPVLQPEPQPEPVAIPDPAPEPPVVEEPPAPEPVPVEEPPAPPVEEVAPEPPVEPAPEEPPLLEPEPEPAPVPEPEPPLVIDIAPEPPIAAPDATDEEKEIVAQILIEQADGKPVTAEAIQAAGLTYADLPPATPVEVRQDENGNEVVITAEVAAALEVLANPAELINAIFTDPAQALLAIGSIGADMSAEERAESEKTVVAAVIVGQIAGQAAVTAAAGAAAYRRKP